MSGQLKVTGNIMAAHKLQQIYSENLLKLTANDDTSSDAANPEEDKALLDVSGRQTLSQSTTDLIIYFVVGSHFRSQVRFGFYSAAQSNARGARFHSSHSRLLPI